MTSISVNFHNELVDALRATTRELEDEINAKYSKDDLVYRSILKNYRCDMEQVEINKQLLDRMGVDV